MMIYALCRRCDIRNTIKTNATNRSELERENGEIITVRCSNAKIKENIM